MSDLRRVAKIESRGYFQRVPGHCFRCGGQHQSEKCRLIDAECRSCGKIWHIQRMCKLINSKSSSRTKYSKRMESNSRNVKSVDDACESEISGSEDDVSERLNLVSVNSISSERVTLFLDGLPCEFEVDSGSAYTIISEDTYRKLWPSNGPKVEEFSVEFRIPLRKVILWKIF